MKYPHKVFERDHIMRDKQMKPVGRVILNGEYLEGERLAVTLLRVPRLLYPDGVLGQVFFIDQVAYRVPTDVNPIKVGGNKVDHLINSFYMERLDK